MPRGNGLVRGTCDSEKPPLGTSLLAPEAAQADHSRAARADGTEPRCRRVDHGLLQTPTTLKSSSTRCRWRSGIWCLHGDEST